MKEFLLSKLTPYLLTLLDATPQGSHVSVALIDFSQKTTESVQIVNGKVISAKANQKIFFDLASLSKPLLLAGNYFNNPLAFDQNEILLLNHRAGIPSYLKLDDANWQEQIAALPIKESPVNYADYSAIRLMLNLQEKGVQIFRESSLWLDADVKHWTSLSGNSFCPTTGKRNGKAIQCVVHDPIAYRLNAFLPHAGLFSTIDGFAKTLINMNQRFELIKKMSRGLAFAKYRFHHGLEINKNIESRPGGSGYHGKDVFGHRGYTGTSFWIHPQKNIGIVIFSNTSSLENGVNQTVITNAKHMLRQKITDYVWRNFKTTSLLDELRRLARW